MIVTNLCLLDIMICYRGLYIEMFLVEDVSDSRESEKDIVVKCLRAAYPG